MNRKFSTINEIPKAMRRIGKGALSLEQAEGLINSAQAQADETGQPFSVCYGQAKAAFTAQHELKRGFWVPVEG